jgi:hypothetical protein
LAYLAIIAVLFHRLFLGEVLSPAANLWVEVPFRSQATQDLTPYFNGIQGDVWRACEPWHIYQYAAAQSGQFPLWNPHIFCGFPFHGNAQSATLSPFHWIYFVVHPRWATGAVAALKLWVAAFATCWLALRLSMTPLASFLAGAVWMLSAFNVRWLLWPLASATVWLPVMLLVLDALVEAPSWRRVGLAGLAATVLQLSGHPECQFYVGVLCGLYVLLRVVWLKTTPKQKALRVLLGLAAHVLGLAGAAISLAPFIEQMHDSMDWRESTHAPQYLPVEGLLGAIAPDHFGRPRAGRIYYNRLNVNYIEAGLYIGLIPLALAGTALLRVLGQPRQMLNAPLGCAAAIFGSWLLLCGAIVLGLPGITPIVRGLPLFSKSDTLRLLFGVQFACAMLAGIAWTWISQRPGRITGWSLVVMSGGFAVILAALLLIPEIPGLYSHREGLRVLWTDPTTPSPLQHRSLRTLVSFIFALMGVLWAAMCVQSIRIRHGEAPSRFVAATVVLLVLGDLGWVAYGFNPIVPSSVVFPEAPDSLRRVAANLRDGRMIATDEILAPNLAMVYGFRDLRGYDFPIDMRWARLFNRLGWIGQKASITLLPRDHVIPCVRPQLQSVLDKCAVRFLYTNVRSDKLGVCSEDDEQSELPVWPLVQYGPGEDAVYQNPTAYARAYFARQATEADPETALAAVLDTAHDLREHSFVEGLWEPIQVSGVPGPLGSVVFEKDGADEVILRTTSEAPALLVLSDRYDPAWQVEIDRSAARPLRTNYLFRGVVVPAGEHTVRWFYRPASFVWGQRISAATLVVLVAFLFMPRLQLQGSAWFAGNEEKDARTLRIRS